MPRERKPTALKLLQGNPGKRPLPEREPKYAPGAKPPEYLSPAARAEWARIAPRLVAQGVLTEADGDALGIFCTLYAAFQRYAREGKESSRLAAEMRQYLAKFGMTPADRSRVEAVEKCSESKLSRFTRGPGGRGR